MKRYLITLLIVLTAAQSSAQTAYDAIDRYSTVINNIEKGTEGKTLGSFQGDSFMVSLPETSFRLMYHNGLAFHAVYLKDKDQEYLQLIENIDFSKAVSIVRSHTRGKQAAMVNVYFPPESITVDFYRDGKKFNSEKRQSVGFLFPSPEGDFNIWSRDSRKLYDTLSAMIFMQKIAAGNITPANYRTIQAAWDQALKTYTEASLSQFAQQYGNSLYGEQATRLAEAMGARDRTNKMYIDRMDSIALTYKFRWDLTEQELITFNPEAYALIRKYTGSNGYYTKKYNGIGKPWPEGAYAVTSTSARGVSNYSYVIKSGKKEYEENKELYEQLKKTYSQLFPEKLRTEKDNSLMITAPDKSRYIQIYFLIAVGHSAVLITFSK